jgi:hypothetical protein
MILFCHTRVYEACKKREFDFYLGTIAFMISTMKPKQWRLHNLLSKLPLFVHVFLRFSKNACIDGEVFSFYRFKYFRVF